MDPSCVELSAVGGAMPQWYVMRDLKRPNAKLPAFRMLAEVDRVDVFTPMKWVLVSVRGKQVRREVPFLADLLFVRGLRADIDPIVDKTPTLQYRYQRGAGYCVPMTVRAADMQRFITAVRSAESPVYYQPGEVTEAMIGRRVRIVGGALDGYTGHLQAIRGARRKRLLIALPSIIVASVEVDAEYIQFIK